MTRALIKNVSDLKGLAGEEFFSQWHLVTQEQVDLFAEATGDHQWIHTDPERATRESPYGGPIAHGYLTLALAPMLRAECLEVENKKMTINYGLDKLRFPAPLPVGKRVRMKARLDRADGIEGGLQTYWTLTFEVEGQEKPACVAAAVYRYLS